MHTALVDAVSRAIGTRVHPNSAEPIGGGSIHACFRLATQQGFVFLKAGSLAAAAMFEAEAAGLQAIEAAQCVRVPAVRGIGATDAQAFLCLEWLDLSGARNSSQMRLGEQLATMHRVCGDAFGFDTDNFIGSTPQRNSWCDRWPQFFREHRLAPQLALAKQRGADSACIDRGERLLEVIDAFFDDEPTPSLVHGDLWGGNWGALANGAPVIFDPAVYYGDRETDLAMTRLFGGFHRTFYDAYEAAWPLAIGAEARVTLYNLYHVLNHFNLFGGGYLAQASAMMNRLLAQAAA